MAVARRSAIETFLGRSAADRLHEPTLPPHQRTIRAARAAPGQEEGVSAPDAGRSRAKALAHVVPSRRGQARARAEGGAADRRAPLDLIRKARRTHHELLERRFGDALDDDDVADLTRIMERIAASSR